MFIYGTKFLYNIVMFVKKNTHIAAISFTQLWIRIFNASKEKETQKKRKREKKHPNVIREWCFEDVKRYGYQFYLETNVIEQFALKTKYQIIQIPIDHGN